MYSVHVVHESCRSPFLFCSFCVSDFCWLQDRPKIRAFWISLKLFCLFFFVFLNICCDVMRCVVMWCVVMWGGVIWFAVMIMMRCGVIRFDERWCEVMRCDVIRCDEVWCDRVWCGVMQCNVVWCDKVWCGVIWSNVMRCDVMGWGKMWCDMSWCDVIFYSNNIF